MTNDHPSVCSWTILGKFSNQRTAFYDFCSVMLMICGKRITNPANGYICCRTHRDPNLRWNFPSSSSPPPLWKQILRSRVQNFKSLQKSFLKTETTVGWATNSQWQTATLVTQWWQFSIGCRLPNHKLCLLCCYFWKSSEKICFRTLS